MAKWLQPVVKSIVVCEDVLSGPTGTGNVHLMNVFSAVRPQGDPLFPQRKAEICIFLQITDAEGAGTGSVTIRQAESGEAVIKSNLHTIQFRDRLQLKYVVFRLRNCPFPKPGVYWVEFYLDGRWVTDQAFRVHG